MTYHCIRRRQEQRRISVREFSRDNHRWPTDWTATQRAVGEVSHSVRAVGEVSHSVRAARKVGHYVNVDASTSGVQKTGRCACGEVRYRCLGSLRPVINCHCERCRRITGHHMAASGCSVGDLEMEAQSSLRWYEASPGVFYGFCGSCGSTLFWRADGLPDWISIAAGTLDQPTGLSTTDAWWVAEAGDYHELAPGLRNYDWEPSHT
ncbi:MAG: GFA family protein [Ornithinimicrobium sp.]